jgi:enoyl-CoA hydratase/carnithine racemase
MSSVAQEVSGYERVTVEVINDYWEITLRRPRMRNAIDSKMRDELYTLLSAALRIDAKVGLRGDGPAFCAGGDLTEFGTMRDAAHAHEIRTQRNLAWLAAQLSDRMVVAIHGPCYGAGLEIAAFAGRVIAAPSSRFCLPELHFGLIPGAGGTVSVPRRIGRRAAFELIVTGRLIRAPEALRMGLVDELVGEDELTARLREVGSR